MMEILRLLLLLLLAVSAPSAAAGAGGTNGLREGDLVFIRSVSAQSGAVAEVMRSSWTHVGVAVMWGGRWFVAEAAGRVKLTPWQDFLRKSSGGAFIVKRLKIWADAVDRRDVLLLKEGLLSQLGKRYDVYFEWSDSELYCSEYVWKAYSTWVSGHPALSRPQTFSDLRLDGPLAKALVVKRYGAAGRTPNPAEPIVTPAALLGSELLMTVAVE